MFEAEFQINALVKVLRSLSDFRDAKGRAFSLVVLGFSLFFTELAKLKSQRRRNRWLKANWAWAVKTLEEHGEFDIPDRAPSQSTISRALNGIDFWGLMQQHLREMRSVFSELRENKTDLVHYAVDGKAREGIQSKVTGRTESDVTIYEVEVHAVLAKSHLSDKKGEGAVFRRLLSSFGLELPRGIFTMDAGITSPKTLKLLRKRGHEYISAIKGNCGNIFELACTFSWDKATEYRIEETGHGRHEIRIIQRVSLASTDDAEEFEKYDDCGSVLLVTSTRQCLMTGESSTEMRYFIISKGIAGRPLPTLLSWIREHWLQENHLHWAKDAILGEDQAKEKSARSSRVLGFFKDMVICISHALQRSVSELTDSFQFKPEVLWRGSN